MDIDDRMHNRREVARILGCSEAAVRRWEALGVGPVPTRIGRLVRFTPDSIREFVERNTQGDLRQQSGDERSHSLSTGSNSQPEDGVGSSPR